MPGVQFYEGQYRMNSINEHGFETEDFGTPVYEQPPASDHRALTRQQWETAARLGKQIRRHEQQVTARNGSVALDWWELGRWLETETALHDGKTARGSISAATATSLCKALGLSTKPDGRKNRVQRPSGSATLTRARQFYRMASTAEARDAVIREYRNYGQIMSRFLVGRPPRPERHGSFRGEQGAIPVAGFVFHIPSVVTDRLMAVDGADWPLVRQVLKDALNDEANLQYLEVVVKQAVAGK